MLPLYMKLFLFDFKKHGEISGGVCYMKDALVLSYSNTHVEVMIVLCVVYLHLICKLLVNSNNIFRTKQHISQFIMLNGFTPASIPAHD